MGGRPAFEINLNRVDYLNSRVNLRALDAGRNSCSREMPLKQSDEGAITEAEQRRNSCSREMPVKRYLSASNQHKAP